MFSHDLWSYRVSESGILVRDREPDKDGNPRYECVTNNPVIIDRIGISLDNSTKMVRIAYKPLTGSINREWVTLDTLLTNDVKRLINFGIVFPQTNFIQMIGYFNTFINRMSKTIERTYISETSGWKSENAVFTIGSNLFDASGRKEILTLNSDCSGAYTAFGERGVWVKNCSPILEHNIVRMKIYATVSPMIMKLIDAATFTMHQYSESGTLKTVSTQVAASVIGNPNELLRDADATRAGIEQTLKWNTDTPVFFDETSNNKFFSDLIYMIGNEKGKTRSNKDLGITPGGRWKTVVQTTGETPISKGISTKTGEEMRFIEIYEGIPRLDTEYVETLKDTINENYGLFLDDIMAEIFRLKPHLKELKKDISSKFGTSSTVFTERIKKHFITLAVAGTIVEKVFRDAGIPEKDPICVCKEYFDKMTGNDPTVPYHVKALDVAYNWYTRNQRSFEFSKEADPSNEHVIKGNVEEKGWVLRDGVIFEPDMLRKHFESIDINYIRVLEDWKKHGILTRRSGKTTWKYDTKIRGRPVRGIYIKFDVIESTLHIEDAGLKQVKLSEVRDATLPGYDLARSVRLFLLQNPEYKNVTTPSEDVARLFLEVKSNAIYTALPFEEVVSCFDRIKSGRTWAKVVASPTEPVSIE